MDAVKNLTFSVDYVYTNLDQKMEGTISPAASAGVGKPADTYRLSDQHTHQALIRAQRTSDTDLNEVTTPAGNCRGFFIGQIGELIG